MRVFLTLVGEPCLVLSRNILVSDTGWESCSLLVTARLKVCGLSTLSIEYSSKLSSSRLWYLLAVLSCRNAFVA